ncbi:MAG: peptidoglycan editing factor PgeF [Caulobacteraceae bacterium]|nr:peptidoglycan editing factor PgeF [Caulobacteraceae bacterium]
MIDWSENTMSSDFLFLSPHWPGLDGVRAYTVAGARAASDVDFKGVDELAIRSRHALEQFIGPTTSLRWLEQPHGRRAVRLPDASDMLADGAVTDVPGVVCAMRSADCLPVFFAVTGARSVGIAHAGWKGLRDGVIVSTFEALEARPSDVFVWLGPAISGPHYEVGDDIREEFAGSPFATEGVFKTRPYGKYQMDLYAFARSTLQALGIPVENISGGGFCTFSDVRLHSVRRDGKAAGRMASLIWIER